MLKANVLEFVLVGLDRSLELALGLLSGSLVSMGGCNEIDFALEGSQMIEGLVH